jgi:hypothetical protein
MNRLIAPGWTFRLGPSIVHAVRDCCCQRRLKGPDHGLNTLGSPGNVGYDMKGRPCIGSQRHQGDEPGSVRPGHVPKLKRMPREVIAENRYSTASTPGAVARILRRGTGRGYVDVRLRLAAWRQCLAGSGPSRPSSARASPKAPAARFSARTRRGCARGCAPSRPH